MKKTNGWGVIVFLIAALCSGAAWGQSLTVTNGLTAWLKADGGVTTNASGQVSLWADQSGNSTDGAQSADANKPVLVGNVLNGKPVVRFDGSTSFLGIGYTHLYSGLTYLVVLRTTANASTSGYEGNAANNIIGDNTGAIYVGFGVNGGKGQYNHYGAGWQHVNGLTAVNDGNAQLVTVIHSQADSSVNLYVGGNLDRTGSIYYNSPYASFNRIGGGYVNGSATADLFNGDLAEILIYNRALSNAERQSAEQYLGGKYRVAGFQEPGTVFRLSKNQAPHHDFWSFSFNRLAMWTHGGWVAWNPSNPGVQARHLTLSE